MADLTGQQLKDSYQNLLTIDATIESNPTSGQLENGLGNPITALGIGTDAPASNLEISGNATRLMINTANSAQSVGLLFALTQSSVASIFSDVSEQNLIFNTSGSSEAMRIDSGGDISFRDGATNEAFYWDASTARLGIGTTSPTARFTISGGNNTDSQICLINTAPATDNDWFITPYYNDQSLRFRANSASVEVLTLLDSGNVGIGTTSPATNLHIEDSGGSTLRLTTPASGGTNVIQAAGYDSANVSRFSSAIDFQSVAGSGTANGHIIFSTYPSNSKTERMRILSSGGITFNGDTATANALDDYEEGTWTSTVAASTNLTSIVEVQNKYTKIGNVVNLNIFWTADVTSASAETNISFALPFTTGSTSFSDVGHVAIITGSGADRFGVGSLYRGSTTQSQIVAYIAGNQINATGSAEIRASLTYIIE
jgi:hypothetical protein